jgi:hypothetical protein
MKVFSFNNMVVYNNCCISDGISTSAKQVALGKASCKQQLSKKTR